jgi:hypothetical protein
MCSSVVLRAPSVLPCIIEIWKLAPMKFDSGTEQGSAGPIATSRVKR